MLVILYLYKSIKMKLVSENNLYKIYNKTLNPKLWETDKLKSIVSKQLRLITKDFLTHLFDDIEIENNVVDTILTGSSAGYNWNLYSDIDLHVVVDFSKFDKNEQLIKNYFNTYKSIWNSKHSIKIYDYKVEFYFIDIKDPINSASIYSLMMDKWIKKPKKEVIKIDKTKIKKEYSIIVKDITDNIKENNIEKLENLLLDLYNKRGKVLQEEGEYSEFNIVFKLLRLNGYLKLANNMIIQNKDAEFTLKQ